MLLLAIVLAVSPPTTTVKNGNDQLQKLIADGGDTQALAAKAEQFIDFAELARRALGPAEWGKLKPKQQEEFITTMKGLLRASYAKKAVDQGRQGAPAWGEEKITGDEATVASSVLVDKEKFPVEYRLYRKSASAEWRIYDVVTDGVSLVDTYSDQFRQLIAKKGYEGLLATLKQRKAQLEAAGPKTAER